MIGQPRVRGQASPLLLLYLDAQQWLHLNVCLTDASPRPRCQVGWLEAGRPWGLYMTARVCVSAHTGRTLVRVSRWDRWEKEQQ